MSSVCTVFVLVCSRGRCWTRAGRPVPCDASVGFNDYIPCFYHGYHHEMHAGSVVVQHTGCYACEIHCLIPNIMCFCFLFFLVRTNKYQYIPSTHQVHTKYRPSTYWYTPVNFWNSKYKQVCTQLAQFCIGVNYFVLVHTML